MEAYIKEINKMIASWDESDEQFIKQLYTILLRYQGKKQNRRYIDEKKI